ncbi:MAG: tetratricopeptide repeat protein [Xanthomonadales bacterium]|nr:tetratricopeptide repeat protein [Xanthomonadales bacterium]
MNEQLDHIAALIGQGRPDLAAEQAAKVRALYPMAVEPARLHGVALLSAGRVDEAIDVLQVAQAIDPASIETLCNLGSALLARNDARAALTVLHSAQLIAAGHPAVLNGIGTARRALGDAQGSRDAYRAATRAAPGFLGAWLNLAAAELVLAQPRECERIVRMILQQTAHAEAWLLLAQALAAQGRLEEAAVACSEGERVAPNDARLAYQLGMIADEQNRPGAAAAAHERALALDPGLDAALAQLVFLKRQLCDWTDLDALSERLRHAVTNGAAGVTPFGFLAEAASADEQLHCARNFAEGIIRRVDPMRDKARLQFPRHEAAAPLRIGFASNGFGKHPTGLLTVAFFEALQRRGVDFHLFATAAADGSTIQQRLRASARQWRELGGLPAPGMATRIAECALDVLVDLRVWGGGNISEALALRPAPLQINWLAYPGTSGAGWIDYVIADRHVLTADMRRHFSECVAWLPRCFQPSDPGRVIAEPPSRRACGLPESGVVYVCFNNSYKLDPRSVDRMLAILKAVPGSVLWLLSGPENSDANLRARIAQTGVDPERIVFMPKLPHAEYLSRYRHADLFLDTAHYNAHTTASDALWAGCPLLTTPGETFAARVAASLNHHLGMDALNAANDDAYVGIASHLGNDPGARAALRAQLGRCRQDSGLFDMDGFADDFLSLVQRMVDRQRAGLAPAPIE